MKKDEGVNHCSSFHNHNTAAVGDSCAATPDLYHTAFRSDNSNYRRVRGLFWHSCCSVKSRRFGTWGEEYHEWQKDKTIQESMGWSLFSEVAVKFVVPITGT